MTAVTYDGRNIDIVNHPGRFGLEKLINSAQRKRKENGVFELTWSAAGVAVAVDLKIISSAQVTSTAPGETQPQGFRGLKLPATIAGSSGASMPMPAAAGATGDAAAQGVRP